MENKSPDEPLPEIEKLRAQLAEAEETLRAIRRGEVDALVVSTPQGDQVFTLKGAEHPYRILMERMKDGAVTLAGEDTIFYCNQGFADMLKIPLEKMIGTEIFQFVSPADKAVFEELLRQGRESSSKGEVTFLTGDGTAIPTHLSVSTMLLDGLSTVYLVATDITQRKLAEEALQKAHDELEIKVKERTAELRESEQRWATTLASIGDAVISSDAEGRINFMNSVAEALTGWTQTEASKKTVKEVFNIINEYTRAEVEDPVARVLQEGTIIGLANHTILVRKDGTEVPIDDSGAPIRDGNGKTMGVVLVFRNISERKRAEEALAHSSRRVSEILESITDGFMAINNSWCFTYVNQRAAGNLGLKPEDLIGQNIWEKFPAVKDTDHEIYYRKAMQQHEPQYFEIHGVLTDKWYEIRVYPSTEGISVFWQDITERKQAVEALRKAHDQLETRVQERTAELEETNARYRELSESINEIFFAMDKDLKYTYWNKLSEALTGVSAKDAIRKSLYELFPDVKGTEVERLYLDAFKTQQSRRFVSEYTLGGRKYIFEVNVYPSKGGISVIAKDITERKRAEEQLKESLKEKETLLKEVHHRVKNNMQVISSLLMLQEDLSTDGKITEMLKDSQNRISSMALIHERLYRSGNLSKVDLKDYVDDLVSGLFQSYGVSESRVALNINIENVLLGIDSAIPCGLVINELVSNSLKHAFPEDKNGEINISLRLTDGNMIELLVGDNGTGIPEDMDIRKTRSLGLYLVTLLVENQLHGEIILNRERGTQFQIKFRA